MKAAVTTGEKGKIIVKDIPKPQVQPGSLLLKTKCCSICGTDLEYVDGSLEFLSEGSGKPHAGVVLAALALRRRHRTLNALFWPTLAVTIIWGAGHCVTKSPPIFHFDTLFSSVCHHMGSFTVK